MAFSNQGIIIAEFYKGDLVDIRVSPFVSAELKEEVFSSLKDIMVSITQASDFYRIHLELAVSVGDQ